jgi:hypothetical protein
MNIKLAITKMPEFTNKERKHGSKDTLLPSDIKHLLECVYHDANIQGNDDNNVDICMRFFELDGEPIFNFIHEWLNHNKDDMEIELIDYDRRETNAITENNPIVELVEVGRTSYIKLLPFAYKKDNSITVTVQNTDNEESVATVNIKLKGIKLI